MGASVYGVGASVYGVGASVYGVGASVYGVRASVYGSLVILVSAQGPNPSFCQAQVQSPKVQSPKVKTKRTWADTKITRLP